MKNRILFLLIIVVLTMFKCSKKSTAYRVPEIAIMAYYVPPENNYHPEALPLDKLTHIIFSFTEVIDQEMKFKNPGSSEKLSLLVKQKKNHPHIKVMVACGGWGGSGGFSDMAASPENRKKFVDSVTRFLNQYQLDGLDIDWEYPGMRGAGNPFIPEDKANFTFLMRELREAMDATDKDMVLTFASAGWKRYYDHVELNEVLKYANYMNVMTYDLVGGRNPFTGHHTNLGWIKPENLEGTPAQQILEKRNFPMNPRSAEKIISFCTEEGVDPKQIVIGAAFYGRAWQGVPPENHGLYQENTGVWIGWAPYSDIRAKYEGKNGFVRYWDPVAKAPFLYNAEDSLFISYEDTVSVKLKTEYAINNGLGGIMFWELRLDTDKNGLLDAIYEEATESVSTK
jgi:chitinase